jgi:hypothetical protein
MDGPRNQAPALPRLSTPGAGDASPEGIYCGAERQKTAAEALGRPPRRMRLPASPTVRGLGSSA